MLRACTLSGRFGRVFLLSALSLSAAATGSESASADDYSTGISSYDQPIVPRYMRLPTVVQAANWQDGDAPPPPAPQPPADVAAPDVAVADGNELVADGCNGGGCNGSGCDSCGSCFAQRRGCDRWYLGLSGGWQQREMVHESEDASTFIGFDGGFAINAALGYRFDVFRVEAEYSFMDNECSEAGSAGLSSATVGNISMKAFMFNVYHDIEIDGWCWKPYVGAGIGIYQSDINGLFPDFFQTVGGAFATTPINATSNMPFAYQFRVGASRPLGERTEFYTGYRYFHGEELTFSAAPFAGPGAPVFQPDGAWTHGVEFGLRVRF